MRKTILLKSIIISAAILTFFSSYALAGGTWTFLDMPRAVHTQINGIDDGNIVGHYWDINGDTHGFLYDGSKWTKLDMPGGYDTIALGISGRNIVGWYEDVNGIRHGFLYDGLTWTVLDMPGAYQTFVRGISDGNIVGSYSYGYGSGHPYAFLYNGSEWKTLDFDYPFLYPVVYGIDGGNIVGTYSDGYITHGLLYDGQTYTTIDYPDALTTDLCGISGHAIVGNYVDASLGSHAFLYNGTWTIFNVPVPAEETFINSIDGLQMAGYYSYGRDHGFIYTFENKFGSFNGGKNSKLTLKDYSGKNVTFSLSGGGYGQMDPFDCNFEQIELFETTDKSVLSISTQGKTKIGSIICNGPLKGISAKNVNLRGNISITGSLGSLTLNDMADNHTITIGSSTNSKAGTAFTFGRVSDLAIDSNMPIKSITATDWSGGEINAPSVGSITIKGNKKLLIPGDLDVNVAVDCNIKSVIVAGTLSGNWNCNAIKSITDSNLDTFNLNLRQGPDDANRILALGTLNVKGGIYSSNIQSAGHIGKVSAGIMADSNCFAGVAEGIDGLPDASEESFPDKSTIKSIAIKGIKGTSGPYFVNSNIAATNIQSASIVEPQSDDGGEPFGLCADYIKKLTIKDTNGVTTTLSKLNEPKDSNTIDGVEIRLY